MKKRIISIALLGILSTAAAYATNVNLVNASPEQGQMLVQYQFLNADKEPLGPIAMTLLPSQISLPQYAEGIRVFNMQNNNLPKKAAMIGGWYNFPAPGCTWTNDSGHPPIISFSLSDHSISCQ